MTDGSVGGAVTRRRSSPSLAPRRSAKHTGRVIRLAQDRRPFQEAEEGLVFAPGLGALGLHGLDEAVSEDFAADEGPQVGVLGQALDEKRLGSRDGGLGVGDALLGVPERERPEAQRLAFLGRLRSVSRVPDPVGESGSSPASLAATVGPFFLRRGRNRSSRLARSVAAWRRSSRSGVSFFWRSAVSRMAARRPSMRSWTSRAARTRRSAASSSPPSRPCGSGPRTARWRPRPGAWPPRGRPHRARPGRGSSTSLRGRRAKGRARQGLGVEGQS